MQPLPRVAPFADRLADLAADLHRGNSCLVTADKGWTQLLYQDLRERLHAVHLHCRYLDGRPVGSESAGPEVGVMLLTIAQLRQAVRSELLQSVLVLPHLDLMTCQEGGWTSISREMVPLLYENPSAVLLGFRDPTLALLPVVEKLFPRRYTIESPVRECVAVACSPRGPSSPAEAAPAP
jgi:hypothetical protein